MNQRSKEKNNERRWIRGEQYKKLFVTVRVGDDGPKLHPNNESLLAAVSNPNAKFDPLQICDS
jgi:hypothetical protein